MRCTRSIGPSMRPLNGRAWVLCPRDVDRVVGRSRLEDSPRSVDGLPAAECCWGRRCARSAVYGGNPVWGQFRARGRMLDHPRRARTQEQKSGGRLPPPEVGFRDRHRPMAVHCVIPDSGGNGDSAPQPPPNKLLVSLTCRMAYGARVDGRRVCHGAYLKLDSLLSGRPIGLGDLGPIHRSWDYVEYRIVNRSGSVFRLASDVNDPRYSSKHATIVVDLARGIVTYSEHRELGGRDGDSRAKAHCEVRGWVGNGPGKSGK